MPRTCFVIMPFSNSNLCTEEEWTLIYDSIIKPAIEGANLDYECRRSAATRGNVVAAILQELRESYVVIADLTDANPNVFYELGVRHSLKDRTILISQNRDDIPFDLRAYANHVYDWQTEEGKEEFAERIEELLNEIDTNPERPDNPVSDFLGRTVEPEQNIEQEEVIPAEIEYAQSLVGASSEGLNTVEFTHRLVRQNNPQSARTVLRLTRADLNANVRQIVNELNQREITNRIQEAQVLGLAMEFVNNFYSQIKNIEQFTIVSTIESWAPGLHFALKIAGDLISVSESFISSRIIKFSQGAPALLAWQLLMLCGAKALQEEHFELLRIIIKESIEVEDSSGRFSNQPLILRRDLFWPEGLLGNAMHGARYLVDLWSQEEHLHEFFTTIEQYHFEMAKFYMLVVLASPADDYGHPLYPGYRYFPQARRAMSSLCTRLAHSDDYLNGIALALGETAEQFRDAWSERVRRINDTDAGSFLRTERISFPDPMDSEI